MPWFKQEPRERPEEGATLQQVFGSVRVMLNHFGGMVSSMANMALVQTRQDARLEAISDDVAAIRLMLAGVAPGDSDGT